jgi:alkylation response protein AidB-like acyl-CoA dehydrogenase
MRFTQTVPDLPDTYAVDVTLRAHLDRALGELGHKHAAPLLEALAADASAVLRPAAVQAERHPPAHRPYDGWGRRIDEIETSEGWETLRAAAARHGVVALPYEPAARRTWGPGARVVQHALLHLYSPDSAIFSCPVAMSDGAVTVLTADGVAADLRDRLVPRLLARDPDTAWTSGQWMTETEGGSDVGRVTTRAVRTAGGWRLFGEKWFCSATTAEVAIALARPEGAAPGSAGLACFVIPRYADQAAPGVEHPRGATGLRATAPGLRIHRLKDKLGTHALPSAEVQLDGAAGWPVADPLAEGGLRRMMALVTVTRLHNAANATALLRRGLLMARTYAQTREAFGAPLWRQPLHREVLAGLAVEADAAFALTGLCFEALGRVEVDGHEESAALLRLGTSLAKALTAKQAVAGLSEVVECFGGPGYVEDSGVPVLLRDAQVLPVWEGTTSIQALDLLRVLGDPRARSLDALLDRVGAAAEAATDPLLLSLAGDLATASERIAAAARAASADPRSARTQAGARWLLDQLAVLLAGAALLEQATFDAARGDHRAAHAARLWLRRKLFADPLPGEGDRLFASLVDAAS